METSPLLERLAGGVSLEEGRELARNANPAGLGEAFFKGVAALLGTSPESAASLADHWRAIRDRAQDPAFAYRAQAAGARARGRWKASANAFLRAGRAASDPVERLEFTIGAIDALARAGQPSEAIVLGKRIARRLRHLGRPDLAARAELNVGNALLWQDRYRDATRALEHAAEHLTSPLEVAAARLGLSSAQLFTGRPDRVRHHAEVARNAFDALGLGAYADLCSINLAHEAMSRGRADEALDLLLAIEAKGRGDLFERARMFELLGDAYLELNLLDEASDAYQTALARDRNLPPLNRAHCALGLARAARARGLTGEAVRGFRAAAQRYLRARNPVWEAVARLHLAEGLLDLNRRSAARVHAEGARRTFETTGSRAWLGHAKILQAASAGTPAAADALALEALRTLGRIGSPNLAWRAHAIRAAVGSSKSLAHYRRMFEALLEGRLRTVSTVSRAAYMRDKGDALRAYLDALLARPTPNRVREALDVVARSRSVALLDEIARADVGAAIDPKLLAELRAQLNQQDEGPPDRGSTRRAVGTPALAAVQRRWVEATRGVRPGGALATSPTPDTAVYAELREGIALLRGGRATRLELSRFDLERELRWLQFDLLAPKTEPDTPHKPFERRLRALADALQVHAGTTGGDEALIAPDAGLWGVPWGPLLRLDGSAEPILLPNPALGKGAASLGLPPRPRAALWIYEAPDLPHVAHEGRLFLEHFPDATVCRTLDQVRRSIDDGPYDIVHVATHGRLCISNPMFSLLRFVDGNLYAAEIARSRLRVGLATLSACESGRMAVLNRDEPDGLARAFLARGAHAVLGAAWPLEDAAALQIMMYYYSELSAGQSVSRALARVRDGCRSRYPHPYYWGAPILLAGYGKEHRLCITT